MQTFCRVHRAQSPEAALRDVDPTAIRELAVSFIPLRNAYLEPALPSASAEGRAKSIPARICHPHRKTKRGET
jgi:hypothetical protein